MESVVINKPVTAPDTPPVQGCDPRMPSSLAPKRREIIHQAIPDATPTIQTRVCITSCFGRRRLELEPHAVDLLHQEFFLPQGIWFTAALTPESRLPREGAR